MLMSYLLFYYLLNCFTGSPPENGTCYIKLPAVAADGSDYWYVAETGKKNVFKK